MPVTRQDSVVDPLLVWLAGVSWDSIPGTDRHMVTALSERARVLWVDPPISPWRQSLRESLTSQSLGPRLTSMSGVAVTRLTPIGLPGSSKPVVRTIVPWLVRLQVEWALRKIGTTPLAIVATQLENSLTAWPQGVMKVLYGTDDYVAGAHLMGLSARHQQLREARTVSRADIVAAVSPELAGKWERLGAKPTLMPNGCWPGAPKTQVVPLDMGGLCRPIVGLVGQLSERIDMGALEALANSGYSLLIVGPIDRRWDGDRFRALVDRSTVRYIGQVPGPAVRDYLSVMDIGLTPYRDTPFNRASFPLKTLEYLAAGLPVVSTALPSARWLLADLETEFGNSSVGQVLRLAATPAEFVTEVGKLVDGAMYGVDRSGIGAQADLCITLADRHSWTRRATSFAGLLGL